MDLASLCRLFNLFFIYVGEIECNERTVDTAAKSVKLLIAVIRTTRGGRCETLQAVKLAARPSCTSRVCDRRTLVLVGVGAVCYEFFVDGMRSRACCHGTQRV